MKPFLLNRYGRMVFPGNFFPELDFSIFETLDQFAGVIKRDFEEKAPTETDIVARVESRGYRSRYELLRDLALNLFWVNRYALTMYVKRPTRWRDVPRRRDDVFLPVYKPWDALELSAAIEAGYRALPASWDLGTEDKVFSHPARRLPPQEGGGGGAAGDQAHRAGDPGRSPEPDLPPPRLRRRLPGLRPRRHHRVRARGARAGGAPAPGHGAPQPVPLGPGQDAGDRGRQAPRRRLRGRLPPPQRRGPPVHPPGQARPA